MRLVLVSKGGCPFCSLLKAELTKRGHAFEEIDASDDTLRQAFYNAAKVNTVPQLYRVHDAFSLENPAGERLGGWSDVSANWSTLSM